MLLETFTTVNITAFRRLEWHLCFIPTVRACNIMHPPGPPAILGPITITHIFHSLGIFYNQKKLNNSEYTENETCAVIKDMYIAARAHYMRDGNQETD